MLPEVALIVTVPVWRPVASPADVIDATAAFDDFQVTELVRFTLVPSVNFPVAVYCTLVPTLTD